MADDELELEDILDATGQWSLGFSEIKQSCHRTKISVNLELHPEEVILEFTQESNHSQKRMPSHTESLLLLVQLLQWTGNDTFLSTLDLKKYTSYLHIWCNCVDNVVTFGEEVGQ